MPKVVFKDHYMVLGVQRNATHEEIKAFYRKLARETHPDTLGPDASEDDKNNASELFREVRIAYEHLSDPEMRKAIDLHLSSEYNGSTDSYSDSLFDFNDDFYYRREEPEPIVVPEPCQYPLDGIWCWIEFKVATWWHRSLQATVTVQLDDLFKLDRLPDLPHNAYVAEVIAVDKKGDIVGRSYSLMGLRHNVRRLQAEARRNEDRRIWRQRLSGLQSKLDELARQNKPVGQLKRLVREAHRCIESGSESLGKAEQHDTVIRAIREVKKEIDRVVLSDTTELLLSDLLDGKLNHADVKYNQQLLHKLRVYEFRSGGEYTAPTAKDLTAHYQRCLEGLSNHDQVMRTSLALSDDEATILELVREGAFELAPDTVEVRGNKGFSNHPVEYGFAKVNGELVPAGVITVTESAYKRNGAQYGKTSQFPTLPHGIVLLIRVRIQMQDRQALTAPLPDDKSLQNDVARCHAKLRNPRESEEILTTASYLVAWRPF